MRDIKDSENLAGVHTHTHTHTHKNIYENNITSSIINNYTFIFVN